MYGLHSEYESYSYQSTIANLYGAPLHHSSPILSTTGTWRPDVLGFNTERHGLMSFDRNEPNRIAIRRPTTRWGRFNISPLDQATLVDLVEYDTNNTPFDVQNNTALADTNQVKHPPTFMSKFHAYLRDKVAHFKQPKLKNASTELEALRSQLSVKDKIIEEMVSRGLLLLQTYRLKSQVDYCR